MAADTIFALSTGSGAAGIAVIRISGPLARHALRQLCGDVPLPRQAQLRRIRDPDSGEVIDSGVILFFATPQSFTGEDLVELQVHGSLAVIRQILDSLGSMTGLRAAEAGEFTHRAFLNGKLDLIEVEALGDLLAAETRAQARLAQRYQVGLRQAARKWREDLLGILALTEAYIDFADEGDVGSAIDSSTEQEIASLEIAGLAAEIEQAILGLGVSERIRRGFRIAVLGPPNAGKSSLVNALAARDVAITSPIPGTTRDTIEVHLDLVGLPVVLVDTAGLREALDEIEQAGVARARTAASEADLVVWLAPANAFVSSPYEDALVVRSKSDIIDSPALQESSGLMLSIRTGEGLSELVDELQRRARDAMHIGADAIVVAHARQAAELRLAVEALRRSLRFGANQLELRAEELRSARVSLDRLTGRIGYEEILGAIFSRFCIGK